MNEETRKRAVASIEATWHASPIQRELCLRLLDFVMRDPARPYLSWNILREGIGLQDKELPEEFASAIQYLLGDGVKVLSLAFEIVDDEGQPIPISLEAAEAAREGHINPLTGLKDGSVEDRLLAHFTANQEPSFQTSGNS